jgi:hypothetical protein
MVISDVQAIDVHGHYGRCYKPDGSENVFMSGDPCTIVQRARIARTRITIVSPLQALFPHHQADAVSANRDVLKEKL